MHLIFFNLNKNPPLAEARGGGVSIIILSLYSDYVKSRLPRRQFHIKK